MTTDHQRRKILKTAGLALAAIPLLVMTRPAGATTNAALRAQLKYQDTPNGEWNCTNCLDFIPGPTENARGGCKRIPADDEISPEGYCTAWNTM